jgi:hypothetical protein
MAYQGLLLPPSIRILSLPRPDIESITSSTSVSLSCLLKELVCRVFSFGGGVRGLLQRPKRYDIGRLKVKKSDAG